MPSSLKKTSDMLASKCCPVWTTNSCTPVCVANSADTALALINCGRAPRTVMIFIAPRDRQQGKPFQLSACKFLSWYQVIFPKCKAPTHAHAPHYPCAAEVAATSPRSEEHTSELQSLMRIS